MGITITTMVSVCVLTATMMSRPALASAPVNGIDTAFLPISAAALSAALRANSNNAVELVQLLRQADQQDLADAAYNTLRDMRAKDANNATVLAAYCFALQIAGGGYQYHPGRPMVRRDDLSKTDYDDTLQEAMKLDPQLWLPYTLKGNNLVRIPQTMVQGLALLQKGVELAPYSSFAHYLLGEAYTLRPTPFMSLSMALIEGRKAMSLRPVVSEAGASVFCIYDAVLNNRAQAIKAKKALLAVLPPEAPLDPWTSQQFAALP